MRDVTEQLRTWSEQLADSVPRTEFRSVVTHDQTAAEPRPLRRWSFVVAATAAVAVAVLIAVFVLDGDTADNVVTVATEPVTDGSTVSTTVAAPIPETTTAPPPTVTVPEDRLAGWPAPPQDGPALAEIPYLLPTAAVPSTGAPFRSEYEAEGGPIQMFTQVFVDDTRDAVMTLQTFPGQQDFTPPEVAQAASIDGWDTAVTGPFVGDPETSAWLVVSDPGGYVRLTASAMGNDEASEILASMRRRSDGLPGWEVPAEASAFVEVNGAWSGPASARSLTWFVGTSVTAEMLVSPSHTDLISMALSGPFEQVDVNGAVGWLQATPGGRSSIVWSPDGTALVVLGAVEPSIDLLAVARSVVQIDAAQYDEATTSEPPAGLGDGCSGGLYC